MNKKISFLGLIMLVIIFVTGCCAPIMSTTGLATVDEIDILTLESFPVQINIIAKGNLPDPCTEISEVLQEREGDIFLITIKTYRSPGACIQVITPFEETIPLDVYSLPAGSYTVEVNGVQGTFDLGIDNILSLFDID